MPSRRFVEKPKVCYVQRFFDDTELAYMLDLYDAVETCKAKRSACLERGDTAGVEKYEAQRNEHIDALAALLKSMRK